MRTKIFSLGLVFGTILLAGCVTAPMRLRIVDQKTNRPVQGATVSLWKHEYSMFSRRGLVQIPIGSSDGHGEVVMEALQGKQSIRIAAQGFQDAHIGTINHGKLGVFSPAEPTNAVNVGFPGPIAVYGSSKTNITVQLFAK